MDQANEQTQVQQFTHSTSAWPVQALSVACPPGIPISNRFAGLQNAGDDDDEDDDQENKVPEESQEYDQPESILMTSTSTSANHPTDDMTDNATTGQSRRRMHRVARREWRKAREIDLYPLFLKPLANDKVTPTQLLPLEYRQEHDGWTRVKAVPDSGAVMSVAPASMAPGYHVKPSAGSLRGQHFVAASGTEIPNEGEQILPMQSGEGVWTQQRWQLADVTRPLLSVGEECDRNQYVIFGKTGGIVLNLETGETRKFPRVNGAYEMEMWIPPPVNAVSASTGFGRQGR